MLVKSNSFHSNKALLGLLDFGKLSQKYAHVNIPAFNRAAAELITD